MTNKTTELIGVILKKDDEGHVKYMVYKDLEARKNVFYKCEEMSFDDIREMLVSDNGISISNEGKENMTSAEYR